MIRIQYWGSNIIGVTALPVMRPVLTIAQGRQVHRSVLCPSCSSSLRHESDWATPQHTRSSVVEGAPFFGSWSAHTAYRSAPPWVLSSRVHALVLHKVITARKRLATFTYERFFVRVQRYHVPLKVLGSGETFSTTRNGTDVCTLPCFVRLGHPTSAAFLYQVRNGGRRRNTLAWSGTLGFPLFR